VQDVARQGLLCSVCRMLLDKDYCVRCAGCCSTRTIVFGVQDVARQGLLCSVCRMLLDKDYCVRCAGCCSTRAMCSVCRIFLDSRNILHTERRVLAAALWASDRHLAGDIITHAVNHSLALLMMGKELPGICWANLKISKLLLLHPVGHPLYLYSNEIKFSVQTNVQIMTSSNSLMEVKISR